MESKKKMIQKKKQLNEDDFNSSSDEMDIEDDIRYDQQLKPQKKKKNIEEEEEWSSDENDQMEAEFEFYDPAPEQFHSVKTLINGLIDGESYFSSELSDLICKQPEVGTTIGINNGEEEKNQSQKDVEVIALSTIINLRIYKEMDAIKQIIKFVSNKIQKNCPEKEQSFLNLMAGKEVGLFINERIINLTPKLVPILHSQLLQDLEWVKDQKDMESWNQYNFDYILIISKQEKFLILKKIDVQKKNQKKGKRK